MSAVRELFDIPRDVAYFNCGYMSPLMRKVRAAGEAGVAKKSRPWLIQPADFFDESERLRASFATLIGGDADGVAIVPAVSYAMAVARNALRVTPGQRILVLAEQFPSNVYPWRWLEREHGAELVTVARPDDDDWTRAVLDSIDDDLAIAALPHNHWTDGALLDLAAIGAAVRAVGAHLVLDLTQSLGALPFDVRAVRPDFVACACYKWLLGPYGLGFMWVAPEHREAEPLEHNWIAREGAEDFAGLVRYRDELVAGARRFDVGERSNFVLLPMAEAALEQIHAWGPAHVQSSLRVMTDRIAASAADLGLLAAPPAHRAGHYLGLRADRSLPADLAQRLAAANVWVSVRGTSVRVTPHLYDDDVDVDRLLEALTAALRN